MKKINLRHRKTAFTLIELLIVIAIIGVLATLIMINLSASMRKSRDSQRKADISQISASLENYRTDNKVYPFNVSTSGFVVATTGITALASDFSTYMPTVPTDPQDPASQYKYKSDGNQFKIIVTAPETLASVADDATARRIAEQFFDPALRTRFQISSSSAASNW